MMGNRESAREVSKIRWGSWGRVREQSTQGIGGKGDESFLDGSMVRVWS